MTRAGNKNGSGSGRIVLCSLVPWILGTNSPKYEDLFLCIKTIILLKLLLLRIIYKKITLIVFHTLHLLLLH